jgi:putative MFS transporter
VGVVLDRIPIGRYHRRLLLIAGFAWALAAMEILLVSFTLSRMSEAWSLSGAEAGMLGSASLLGMVFGSWLGGWAADRRGRVATFQLAVFVYAAAAGLTALSVGFYSAAILRVATGVGVGGTATVATAYLSEHLPTDRRGSYLAYLDAFWSVGTVIAVVGAWFLFAVVGDDLLTVTTITDWRLLFAAASAPLLLVPLVGSLRETPYHLVETGRIKEARDRIREIARENRAEIDLSATTLTVPDDDEQSAGVRQLFDPDLLGRTLMISVAWFCANFGFYGVFIWLPETVGAAGLVGGIYRYLLLAGLVQVPGYLSAAYFVDRVGRKRTLGVYLVLAGVATYLFASTVTGATSDRGFWVFLAGLLAASFFSVGCFGALRAYTPELFPTEVRSVGSGVAEGSGRVAGILGPVVAGALVGSGYFVALTPLAAGFVGGGAVVLLFGVRTQGRSLE